MKLSVDISYTSYDKTLQLQSMFNIMLSFKVPYTKAEKL